MSGISLTPKDRAGVCTPEEGSQAVTLIGRPLLGAIVLGLAAIGLAYALAQLGFAAPLPELVLMLAVAGATWVGGRVLGLIAAALAFAYLIAVHFNAGYPWSHAVEIPWGAMGFATAAPILGWLVGMVALRTGEVVKLRRANATLERQLAEKLRAEETLRRYADVVSKNPDYLSFIDRNYRYQVVSDRYLKLLNRPRHAIVGRTMEELWGTEEFVNVQKQAVDKALAGEAAEYNACVKQPGGGGGALFPRQLYPVSRKRRRGQRYRGLRPRYHRAQVDRKSASRAG